MKLGLLLIIFVTFCTSMTAYSCDDSGKIYKVCSDQQAAFQATLEQAIAEDKIVLVKFGADWCPWCQSLHKILSNEQMLREIGNDQLLLSEIGTNMYNSAEKVESGINILLAILEANGQSKDVVKGTPLIVVLRPSDLKAVFINTGDLEDNSKGEGHDKQKVKQAIQEAMNQLRN